MADNNLPSSASIISDAESLVDPSPTKSGNDETPSSPAAVEKKDEIEVFLEESENPRNMVGASYLSSSSLS